MPEKRVCPFCNEQVGLDDVYCRQCGADLKIVSALDEDDYEVKSDSAPLPSGEPSRQNDDEFRDLDYRPKERSVFLIPVLVILLVLAITAAGIFILSDEPEALEDEPLEIAEPDREEDPGPVEAEEEAADPEPVQEEETNEEEAVEAEAPDYNQLDAVLQEWLEQRVDDPGVILVHTAELDDLDNFYEEYDLATDNIIFYEIESKGEEFASVLFGLPFSEWSIKAVFHWRNSEWYFLREEPII